MAEKMFKIEDNQKAWDSFFESAMGEWESENKERLEAIIWTDKEKELYSQKTHGGYISKKILLLIDMNVRKEERVCNNINQLFWNLRNLLINHLMKLQQRILTNSQVSQARKLNLYILMRSC